MEVNIEGMVIKELITNPDERGYFREIIRSSDPIFSNIFGQWSHSLVHQGVVKAWHGHKVQTQWTYAAGGTFKVVVFDTRKGSSTFGNKMHFLIGENVLPVVYAMPPGVVHGLKCVNGPGHILYLTSGQYDLEDELRIDHDDAEINFDWSTIPTIK